MNGNLYTPDRWIMLRITNSEGTFYKILSSWYGGYGGSNSWKLSSGTVSAKKYDIYTEFTQHSGSTYKCYNVDYGMSTYTESVLMSWLPNVPRGVTIQVMPESTLFDQLDYGTFLDQLDYGT